MISTVEPVFVSTTCEHSTVTSATIIIKNSIDTILFSKNLNSLIIVVIIIIMTKEAEVPVNIEAV